MRTKNQKPKGQVLWTKVDQDRERSKADFDQYRKTYPNIDIKRFTRALRVDGLSIDTSIIVARVKLPKE